MNYNLIISIITLNMNGLSTPIRREIAQVDEKLKRWVVERTRIHSQDCLKP